MKNKIFQKIKRELPEIKTNVSLKNYTTFKIGGPAKFFFVAKNKKDLIKAVQVAKKLNPVRDESLNGVKLPFFIIGGGSNILVGDEGYEGLVIKCQMSNVKCQIKPKSQIPKIYVEAGVSLSVVVSAAARNGLSGLEWAMGIPGTVGGAIYGNAGAFGKSIGDFVKEVEVFDAKTKKLKIFKNKNCQFNYRDSIFKKNKNLVIISTKVLLKKEKKLKIERKMKEYLNYRKNSQPLNLPSAGSIFKNPPGLSVAKLIEKCNLKGKKIGNVKISEKHANFIINFGGAKAKNVIKLIKLIKQKVKNKFGIILEEEIQFLGF